MNEDKALQQYFEICKRIYEQMERDGTWPWDDDSPFREDLVEYENNKKEL